MAQQLRTLNTLPEDPGSILSTYVGSQSSVTPVPAEPMPFSSLSGYGQAHSTQPYTGKHMVHRHTQAGKRYTDMHGQAHGTQTCTHRQNIHTHKLFSFSSVLCELENTDSQPYMEGPEGVIALYLLITCIAF